MSKEDSHPAGQNSPKQRDRREADFQVRYSPKVLREQRTEAFKFGIFGIVTAIAGFALGMRAMLHHQQLDMGGDLYRHLFLPGWVVMLLSVVWGTACPWALRRSLQQRK